MPIISGAFPSVLPGRGRWGRGGKEGEGGDLTSEEKIRRCTDMQRYAERLYTEVSLVKYDINNMRQAGRSCSLLTDVTPARQQHTTDSSRSYFTSPDPSARLRTTSFLLYIFISHLVLA